MTSTDPPPLVIVYRNYRGERRTRQLRPERVWYGTTVWYPDPQWLLRAVDLEKDEVRDFAMERIERIENVLVMTRPENVPA